MSTPDSTIPLFQHEVEFFVTTGTETSESLGDKIDVFFDNIYEEPDTDTLLAFTTDGIKGAVVLGSDKKDPEEVVNLVKKHLALAGVEVSSVVFSETFEFNG